LKEADLTGSDLDRAVSEAAKVLRAGGVVAYPTETSYGLGAVIDCKGALSRIFEIKARRKDKPLLVIIGDPAFLSELAACVPDQAKMLMERFWPGPLTILFPAKAGLPWPLCGQTGKIGLRISSHHVARALVNEVGRPVTATSANRSGLIAARTAQEVAEYLIDPAPDYILDGGPSPGGPPSSIVDVTVNPPAIIREGAIGAEDILALCG
jgi:L-threonylcarbamoyladenylate synthase